MCLAVWQCNQTPPCSCCNGYVLLPPADCPLNPRPTHPPTHPKHLPSPPSRPWKATFGLMATGALCNVVLLYCQLRYHETDLSVVPPETRWQQALRALFGARPPAAGAPTPRRRSPPHSPRMPAIDEEKPSGSAAGEAGEAAGPAAAGSPAAAGALPPGSPALSFVDIAASSPARPAAAAPQEWSEVPLGSTQPPSSAEDWMEVGHSGSGSPQLGGSPHAVDAPDPDFGEAAAAGAGAEEAAAGQEEGSGPGAQHTSSEQVAQDVASQ